MVTIHSHHAEHSVIRSQAEQLRELLIANYILDHRIGNDLLQSIVAMINLMCVSTMTNIVVTCLRQILTELDNRLRNPFCGEMITILNQVEIIESVGGDDKIKQNWELLESCRRQCELCLI